MAYTRIAAVPRHLIIPLTIALDHFFIHARPGAPEAEILSALGLVEGTPNVHPGQGTANRRFFFSNSMLELIYIRDEDEAAGGAARDLKMLERSRSAGASPFGLVFRPASPAEPVPFAGWPYSADYLPDGTHFHIGENSERLEEPLCIVMPHGFGPPARQPAQRPPFTTVSSIRIGVPVNGPSAVLAAIDGVGPLSLALGEPHLLELAFNAGAAGQERDIRPTLPLIIRW
jgi:hypothetical protein